MLRYRDRDRATPLNWTMTAWSSSSTSTTKQNRIYQFFRKRFNQRWLQFLFAYYSFSNWLAVSCFSVRKAFVKCLSVCKQHFWWRQIWRHLHVTVLQCRTKFSNGLVRWSMRMMRATNCETMSKFVKVMPRTLWPLLFPGHGVLAYKLWVTTNRSNGVWAIAKQPS